MQQRPKPQVPARYPAHFSEDDATLAIREVREPVNLAEDTPPNLADTLPTLAKSSPTKSRKQKETTYKNKSDDGNSRKPAEITSMLNRSRSGRVNKPAGNSDFLYNSVFKTLHDIFGLFKTTKFNYSKWFEPKSISSSFSVIVRVSVVLKRIVGDSD